MELHGRRMARTSEDPPRKCGPVCTAVLYSYIVSQTYSTRASPNHFLISVGQLLLPHFKGWKMMQNTEPSKNLNPRPIIPRLQSQTQNHPSPLSCSCFSLCGSNFTSEIHNKYRPECSAACQNTAPEPSECITSHHGSLQFRKKLWTLRRPPNSFFFATIDNGSLSGEGQAFGLRAQKGFPVRPQTWKARAECAFGLSTAVISFFPTLLSKDPQHTGGRSKKSDDM